MNDERPPLPGFAACRLWQRAGMDGQPFFSGRWGGARVLIVPNRERADDDDASHLLVLTPASAVPRKPKKDRSL